MPRPRHVQRRGQGFADPAQLHLQRDQVHRARRSARLGGAEARWHAPWRCPVADTGVGIREEHLGLIFEEFTQVPNPMQGRVKGTGLGLPLCRRLARLMHGEVGVRSEIGVGSTFTTTLPLHFDDRSSTIGARRSRGGSAAGARADRRGRAGNPVHLREAAEGLSLPAALLRARCAMLASC